MVAHVVVLFIPFDGSGEGVLCAWGEGGKIYSYIKVKPASHNNIIISFYVDII